MNTPNLIHLMCTAVLGGALAGCATAPTPVAAPAKAAPVAVSAAPVRIFQQAEVDEAASAYAAAYRQTVVDSLAAGKYIESLAYRQANAESCLSSRAYRLLGRELSAEDKREVLRTVVTDAQIEAYQQLAQGYFVRANGLEMFSCDHAGLSVVTAQER